MKSTKEMSPGMKFFFTRIFPLIFISIGAGVTFFGTQSLVKAKDSLDWPSTQGKVIKSEVKSHHSSGSGSSSSTTYHANILYEFSVEKTIFSGTRVAYGDYGSSNSSHARGIVSRYPKGKIVNVYYMAEKPEECLLEPGLKLQSWFLPGFGLIFLIVGCVMAVNLPKSMAKEDSTERSIRDEYLK